MRLGWYPRPALSDYSAETPIDQTSITGALRRPPSLLPWILFGVTAGVLAALTLVLVRQVSAERERADEQAQAHANETARAEKAELALTQLRLKVEPLEAQVEALTTERDELSGRVRTLALEAAKATPESPAEVKPTAAAKPPAKKLAKKKPVKKKKRR
ncbi:MAG: hypothetical protein H6Q89_1812 [Myxococcaceae bacterium]|nr:hypothetical protein [Myxococcaceae bacterium]